MAIEIGSAKSKTKMPKNGAKKEAQPPPPPPPPDVYKLEESELKSLAQEYGLDPIGSKSSVLDRVIRYLKLTKNWKNPSSNAHKKRGKKKKNSSKNEKLQDDKEETVRICWNRNLLLGYNPWKFLGNDLESHITQNYGLAWL